MRIIEEERKGRERKGWFNFRKAGEEPAIELNFHISEKSPLLFSKLNSKLISMPAKSLLFIYPEKEKKSVVFY